MRLPRLPTLVLAMSVPVLLALPASPAGALTRSLSDDPADDAMAPETSVTAGPAEGEVVLRSHVRFRFAASEPASYACAIDGLAVPCDATGASLAALAAGTHVFSVAARDAAGVLDETPATRTFTVPMDDQRFGASGGWRVASAPRAFGHDFRTTRNAGATLRHRVHGVTAIVLVANTGMRLGPVDVYLGRTLIGRVRLAGEHRAGVLRPVATFDTPRSGMLRIVAAKDKPVRIEGVAVVSAPAVG